LSHRGELEIVRPGFVTSFSRNAATSLFTTALDIGVLAALVELARADVVLATWLGTIVGCLSNFAVNRRWSFAAHEASARWQLVRFLPVQVGSSTIQTAAVWVLVTSGGMAYLGSKIAVAIFVYGVWNYPMNRFFVFGSRRAVA
jgi:putative flippase GtrA